MRFGCRVNVDGEMYSTHIEFMELAKGYESNIGEGWTYKIESQFIKSTQRGALEIKSDIYNKIS